jgi:photosystem II stability/assembly factor-like uncharacterized protein
MKRAALSTCILLLVTGISLFFFFLPGKSRYKPRAVEVESDALEAMQQFSEGRAFPFTEVPPDAYASAYEFMRAYYGNQRSASTGAWENLGPNNIGGRTIGIAIDPVDTNIIWLGSASGGLWRSTTGGIGPNAWAYVNTGFPLLGVSSIAIDPNNRNNIYIGTGETYNYGTSFNGIALRTTRGSHGMGILKSNDGGLTWSYSLNWSYQQQRGIWDIVINPLNTDVLYAATTEGVYRSRDAGATWSSVLPVMMVMDLEINKVDTNIVYAAAGNLGSTNKGLYKTANSGANWSILTNGLPPNTQDGRIIISSYASNNKVLMAMVNNAFNTIGLYRSTDEGATWAAVNSTDVAGYQGWYSKGLLMKPGDSTSILTGGIELYASNNAGASLTQISNVTSIWDVHPDIHDIIANPLDPNKVYIITDGGLYRSNNFGSSFYDCNSGYVTSQFYIGSVSATDSMIALGGLQDNNTVRYYGSGSWFPVVGGDGCFNAIDPTFDYIQFASYQGLQVFKSTDQGSSFTPSYLHSGPSAFVSPFIICPSDPNVLYAGADYMIKSVDGGDSWAPVGPTPLNGGRYILSIAVSRTSTDTVYCGTQPNGSTPMRMYMSTDGGNSFTDISGTLPNRYPRDIAVNPNNSKELYVTFSGFGTGHVYKSTDAGATWNNISQWLPNVPFHCIAIDPQDPNKIFAGCDMGVFASSDGGFTWASLGTGMPDMVMVYDLVISPSDRKLMAFTHGNGTYKIDLPNFISGVNGVQGSGTFSLFPNPVRNEVSILVDQTWNDVTMHIYSLDGKLVLNKELGRERKADVSSLSIGTYIVSVRSGKHSAYGKMVKTE